jgi:hypothetical protein
MGSGAGNRFTSLTMVTRLLVLFALVCAAATLGVIGGRATVSHDDGGSRWLDGYHAGVKAERNAGQNGADRVRARFAPGEPAYEAIYQAGRREGQRLGERLGRASGASAVRRASLKAAQAAALPDFAGGWRPSHWYMVKLEAGSSGASVRIGKRVIVTRGRLYGPCTGNADDICAVPQN